MRRVQRREQRVISRPALPMTSCEYDPNAWPGWPEAVETAIILALIIAGILLVAG